LQNISFYKILGSAVKNKIKIKNKEEEQLSSAPFLLTWLSVCAPAPDDLKSFCVGAESTSLCRPAAFDAAC
jgi:hypothetical protein